MFFFLNRFFWKYCNEWYRHRLSNVQMSTKIYAWVVFRDEQVFGLVSVLVEVCTHQRIKNGELTGILLRAGVCVISLLGIEAGHWVFEESAWSPLTYWLFGFHNPKIVLDVLCTYKHCLTTSVPRVSLCLKSESISQPLLIILSLFQLGVRLDTCNWQ